MRTPGEGEPLPPDAFRSRPRPWILVASFATFIFVVVAVLSLSPPPSPTRSSSINLQESEIGPGWDISKSTTGSGGPTGLKEDLGLSCSRRGTYGGLVFLQSSVSIFSTNADAAAYFNGTVADLAGQYSLQPVSIGDEAVFASQSGPGGQDRSIILVFHRADVTVQFSVRATGLWEDLSDRPFSATYRFDSDFFTLARAMASRA